MTSYLAARNLTGLARGLEALRLVLKLPGSCSDEAREKVRGWCLWYSQGGQPYTCIAGGSIVLRARAQRAGGLQGGFLQDFLHSGGPLILTKTYAHE